MLPRSIMISYCKDSVNLTFSVWFNMINICKAVGSLLAFSLIPVALFLSAKILMGLIIGRTARFKSGLEGPHV